MTLSWVGSPVVAPGNGLCSKIYLGDPHKVAEESNGHITFPTITSKIHLHVTNPYRIPEHWQKTVDVQKGKLISTE